MSDPVALFDSEPMTTFFAELYQQQSDFEQYLDDSFRELEALRSDMELFQREVQDQSSGLERSRQAMEEAGRAVQQEINREQAEKIENLEHQYQAAQAELTRLNHQQEEERSALDESIQRQIDELQLERDQLQDELSSARTETVDLAAKIEELNQSNEGDGQAGLEEAQARLEEALKGVEAQEIHIRSLQQERNELDTELDTVRTRAAEMSDSLEQMKRETVEERAEWSAELKQMRRVLERQAETLALGPMPHVAATPSQAVGTPVNDSSSKKMDDPVLGSVMAQFNKIRQERADRRTKTEANPPDVSRLGGDRILT